MFGRLIRPYVDGHVLIAKKPDHITFPESLYQFRW